jgi:PAS domain S-box-containing protein
MHTTLNTSSRHEFPVVIAAMPANAQQRKIAFGALAILVVLIALTIPFAKIELARVDAFVPVVQTVMCVAHLLTAVFLFAQYSVYPQRAVLVLASGFVFSGLFAFVQTLAFPGAYSPDGLIGDGDNSAGWLFMFWHTTFPLTVIFYTLSKDTGAATHRFDASTRVTIIVAIACVVMATAGLTLVATKFAGSLPSLFETATRQKPLSKELNLVLMLLVVVAFVLLFSRKRTMLDYWLLITLPAWLPGLIVATGFTVLRFTLVWYAARIYALCTGSSLLLVLLAETMVVYARLATAVRVGARQKRDLSAAITALEQSKLSLEQLNMWFNSALKNMVHGLSMFDKDQRLILCNDSYSEVYGIEPGHIRPGMTLHCILEARMAGDREKIDAYVEDRVRTVRGSEASYAETTLRDGRTIAMNFRRMPDGGWVAIHQDITERKRAQAHQELLLSELDHRVKNILSRVAVVARYTRQGSGSMDELIRALDSRIQSMADAHALLSRNRWQGADLADLVRRQLAPYTTETNIEIGGPEITLTAAATQALAMVLQELVTNAVKYGSLSTPHGKVSVNWGRRDGADGAPRVVIAWRETGGPPAKAPSQSSYGTNLIRNLIPHELGGTVDLVFAPDGLHCDIEIPFNQAGIAN